MTLLISNVIMRLVDGPLQCFCEVIDHGRKLLQGCPGIKKRSFASNTSTFNILT